MFGENDGVGLADVPSGIPVFFTFPVAVGGNTGVSFRTGSAALL